MAKEGKKKLYSATLPHAILSAPPKRPRRLEV